MVNVTKEDRQTGVGNVYIWLYDTNGGQSDKDHQDLNISNYSYSFRVRCIEFTKNFF